MKIIIISLLLLSLIVFLVYLFLEKLLRYYSKFSFHQALLPVIITNSKYKILAISNEFEKIFKIKKNLLINKNLNDILKKSIEPDFSLKPQENTLILNDIEYQVLHYQKDIKLFNKRFLIHYFLDITELLNRIKEINKEKEEALLSLKTKNEFIAKLGHEFRTPMNAIIGISRALLKYDSNNLTKDQIEGIEHINRSATRLLDLVNDLLDISKIESGKMDVIKKPFSLEKLLADIKNIVEELIKEKNIRFTIRKSNNIPDEIISDSRLLYQILINLLGNSAKFTEKGKIHLHIFLINDHLYFEVEDTGIGISKEDLQKVFDKYSQINNIYDYKKPKGTGLGLPLCKELVELMGGKIEIESEFNKGTIVRFFIPIEFSEKKEDQKEININNDNTHKVEESKQKILLIVSDKNLAQQYGNFLTNNYAVDFAYDGQDGLMKITSSIPDTIVLDLKIPKLSGYEVLRFIRYDIKLSKIPVIVISDSPTRPNENIYPHNIFLQKPVELNFLFDNISKLLKERKNPLYRVLIIGEDYNESRYLKKCINNFDELQVFVLSEVTRLKNTLEKTRPHAIIVDIDNISIKPLDLAKTIAMREKPDDFDSVLIFYGKAQHKINEIASYLKYKEKVLKIFINQYDEMIKSLSEHFNISKSEFEKVKVLVSLVNNEKDYGKIIKVFDNDFMVIGSYNVEETFKFIEKYKPEIIFIDTEFLNKDYLGKLIELKNKIENLHLIGIINKDSDKNLFTSFNDFIIKPLQEDELIKIKGHKL